jgi:hypothetical protein
MAALIVLLVACGGETKDDGNGGIVEPTTPCAAEEIASCRVDQMACQMTDDVTSCVLCAAGEHAATSGDCEAIGGDVIVHDFPEQSIGAGEEIKGMCRSWTLNNDEVLYVNAVELEQDELSHHSNWMFVPDDKYTGPDGIWPCEDRNYSQLSAALSGGVLYAQSTQAQREVQKFPEGIVVRLPKRVRIISDIHILNVTNDANVGHAKLSLYTRSQDEVETLLTPFHVNYHGLTIPPQATSRFTGECDLSERFEAVSGNAFDMKVHYVLPHTHALGTRMFVEALGGTKDGLSIVDVTGFNGEARGKQFDPPLDLTGAVGLRFGCEFFNPTDAIVNYGFGDQEMCEALGFAEMPIGFESSVSESVEGETEGMIHTFTGACDTASFPWDPETKGD